MRSRKIVAVAIAAVGALMLAACSSGDDGSTSGKPVTIRFSWWGSDARTKLEQQVINGFQAKYPNIKIEPETSNYDDYITKLSTSAAANDLPDVLTVIDPFMYNYIEAGQFLDLSTVKDQLDLSKFPADSFSDISGKNGEKFGVSLGVSGHGIIVNSKVFKAYGVTVPDDKTWSWADFEAAALAISKASGGKAVGFNLELTEQMANLWLRQNNERFGLGPGGKPVVDFDAATMAAWFTFQKKLIDEGATNPADKAQELFTAGNAPDQSLVAHDKAGMAMISMNQLKQFETAAGHDLTPVLWPGETQAKSPGGWTKQGTYVSISAATKHKEAAATFVNYLVNNSDAAKIMGLDRGVPANTEIAASLQTSLKGADLQFAQWVKNSQAANKQPYYRVDTGVATTVTQSYARANESTIFGKASPDDAAKSLLNELNAAATK